MITVNIKSDSIYENSIVWINLVSDLPFSAKFSGNILNLYSGKQGNDFFVHSEEKDKRHLIEIEIMGWFKERRIDYFDTEGAHSKYGMRFYPFVSSYIQCQLIIKNNIIGSFIFDLPDDFRIIWYGASITDPKNNKFNLNHAYGPQRSKYVFFVNNASDEAIKNSNTQYEYEINIPIRLGGSKLLKITQFPVYYSILAFWGVALASMSKNISVMLAAIAGVWTFMLRQWGISDLPQRTTFLTFAYLVVGLIIGVWGIAWYFLNWWALFLIIPIIAFYRIVFASLRKFSYEGTLPKSLEKFWGNYIYRVDKKQSSK